MEVGERIKLRRQELKMTQEELAVKVGYTSRTSVAKVEANANGMVQSKLILFANALHTTPAYLLGWEDEPAEEQYKKEDAVTDIFKKLRENEVFFRAVDKLSALNDQQLEGVIAMLSTFEQD